MKDNSTPQKKSWHDDLPFPKRWIYYIAIKLVLLIALIYIALRWRGLI